MLIKSMKVSLNVYLFLMLSVISFSVFAGADPDELTLEEEMQMQEIAKKKNFKVEKETKENVTEEVSEVFNSCVSFPEAIAFKEHFACKANIEKNHLARLNWSFTKLMLSD